MSETDWGGDLGEQSMAERLLQQIPDMAYVLDAEGRFRWWNDRVPEVTGYSDQELDGMSTFDLAPEDQREEAVQEFHNAPEYGTTETVEFDVLTKDGERIPHEFGGTPVFDDEGNVQAVMIVGRDVSSRRERERALRRQRDQLETINRIGEIAEEVMQALVGAVTRDEIEQVVCERLAASDLYQGVWVGRRQGDGVKATTAIGTGDAFGDTVSDLGELDWDRPALRALREGEPVVVSNVQDPASGLPEPVREAAERLDIHAGASFPIRYHETTYAALTLYSARPDAFSEREQQAFRRLGEVMGFAINAVQTERLLLSESVIELEFELTDRDALLTRLTGEQGGSATLEWATPADDGYLTEFFRVEGVDTATMEAAAETNGYVREFRVVTDHGDESTVEVTYDQSVVRQLMDAGAKTRSVEISNGVTSVVAEAPRDADVRSIVEGFLSVYDDAELIAKRVVDRPVGSRDGFAGRRETGLTDRQREVLSAAHDAGYFDWPRECTAEELAEKIGISSATLHYHLRGAQETLVGEYLEKLERG